jgi:hypothetical protein
MGGLCSVGDLGLQNQWPGRFEFSFCRLTMMTNRKGELTGSRLDREYPHQIALPASQCTGDSGRAHREFCAGLSLAPRHHTVRRDDRYTAGAVMRGISGGCRQPIEWFGVGTGTQAGLLQAGA